MITYIGNKRKLVNKIEEVVKRLQPQTCADAFSGSGVVSRMLLGHSKKLYVNDLELYCEILSKCFLVTPSWADTDDIVRHIEEMNVCPDKVGFVSEMYASQERQFYTPENGRRIDGMLDYIGRCVPEHLRPYCLGPLLVKASIHTNTSGVFKGFHKGGWGGKGGHALDRITKRIEVECPTWLEPSRDVEVRRQDACDFLRDLPPSGCHLPGSTLQSTPIWIQLLYAQPYLYQRETSYSFKSIRYPWGLEQKSVQ
jgi:adenine-specific DNA-methyltransferase